MSLQVWLPLNGNLNNQGLSSAAITALSTPTYSNNGKIGQCAYGAYKINYKQTNNEVSVAFWICLTGSSQWTDIFSFGTGLNRIENISASGSTSCMQHWYNTSGSAFITGQDLFTLAVGKWTHVIMTADGQNVRFYINGQLVKTTAQTSTVSAGLFNRDYFYIGCRDGGTDRYSANLNDFRLYDHCLSQKEVQELAKGLVLHYRLAGPGQENLIKNSQLATSWGANSVCTCNNPTGYSFDGECVKITSGTAGNQNNGYGIFLSTSDISYSVGEKLTFSVDIKGRGEHIALWFLGADGNWWTGANFHTYFTQYDDWTRLSVTGTVPSGIPGMMLGLHVGLSNNTLYAKNMKLERGSVQTPWTPHSSDTLWTTMGYSNNIEYDCSGYGNNGTIKYPPVWDVNSPRYTTSYKFDGTAYLTIPNPFPIETVVREFSHTAWIKWDSACNTSNGIHSIAYSNNFFRFALGKGSQIWTYGVRCNADGSGESQTSILTYGALSSLVHNKWYFIAFTFKDGVCKAYLDGEQVASTTSTLVGLKSKTSEGAIGAYMSNGAERAIGNISDSRFYATELSAAAVQELYHSAVIVDNTGKTYAYEYFE